METANFSEFSYGFSLTHELIVSAPGGVTAAPVFPSLVEEAHVGFDLMIKLRPRTTARRHGIRKGRRFIPLYLQFKLCERPKRRPNGPLAKVLAKLFLRFPLRCEPTSLGPSQHDLLLRLISAKRHVYYAAPHFWNTIASTPTLLQALCCNIAYLLSQQLSVGLPALLGISSGMTAWAMRSGRQNRSVLRKLAVVRRCLI